MIMMAQWSTWIQCQLVESIESTFALGSNFNLDNGDEVIMSSVDILIALCKTYEETPFVEVRTVQQWKETYLHHYDAMIDSYGPKSDYRVQRRRVIEDTFDQLIALARIYPF